MNVYVPSQNKSFNAESVEKLGEGVFRFNNVEDVPPVPPHNEKIFYGALNDIQYHPPQYVIQCNPSPTICFKIIYGANGGNNGGDEYLVKMNNQVFLTNSIPQVREEGGNTLVDFNQLTEFNQVSPNDFDEMSIQDGPKKPEPILGIYSNHIVNGNFVTVTCFPGPGYCLIFLAKPLNYNVPPFGN